METLIHELISSKKVFTSSDFLQISDLILNHTALFANRKMYRICEIEMYLCSEIHPDEFTHCHENQKSTGSWYFHRYNNGSYKAGTYKGMDIVIGNESAYFGILIRSIYDCTNDKFISGPCLCVNEILGNYTEVIDFVNNGEYDLDHIFRSVKLQKKRKIFREIYKIMGMTYDNESNDEVIEVVSQIDDIEIYKKVKKYFVDTQMLQLPLVNSHNLFLRDFDFENEQIFSGPRIGLKCKNNKNEKYFDSKYRFLICKKYIKHATKKFNLTEVFI